MNLRDLTDEELAIRARTQPRAVFDVLFERHRGPLYSFLLRQGAGDDRADDLFQMAFLKAFRAIPTLGLGPEIYTLLQAQAGTYRVGAHLHSGARSTVKFVVLLFEDTPREERREETIMLEKIGESPTFIRDIHIPRPRWVISAHSGLESPRDRLAWGLLPLDQPGSGPYSRDAPSPP